MRSEFVCKKLCDLGADREMAADRVHCSTSAFLALVPLLILQSVSVSSMDFPRKAIGLKMQMLITCRGQIDCC